MDIIVVGGGISGLVATKELLAKGHRVTIFESGDVLGGLSSSFRIKNKWIPKTYHHILPNEKMILDMISELDFEKNLFWNNSSICFWFDKTPYRLTKPQDILFFKPLSLISRLRMIKLGIISVFKKNWINIKLNNAEEWVRKIVGDEVTDNLFKPLSKIKFGELSSVSASWFGERLHEAAVNKEKYAYLKGGLQEFIDAIGKDIKRRGGKIYLNSTVMKIEGNKVYVKLSDKQETFEADKIVSSLPPPILAEIADIPLDRKKMLEEVKYKPMICMVAASNHLITPYYWNVFIKPRMSFGGIFHHTSLYPKGSVNEKYLYYFFTYLDEKNELYKRSEKEIEQIYLEDIKKICPDFKYSWTKIFRIKYSSPIYSMNYENLSIKLINNLYLTGVYRKYPSTRTMNTAARSGLETAKFILNEK